MAAIYIEDDEDRTGYTRTPTCAELWNDFNYICVDNVRYIEPPPLPPGENLKPEQNYLRLRKGF